MTTDQELRDLNKLAVDRCRAAFMSVGQLLDDDEMRAAVLVAIAVDMMNGATEFLKEQGVTEKQAQFEVFAGMVRALGLKMKVTGL